MYIAVTERQLPQLKPCLLSPVAAASEDHRNPYEDIHRVQIDPNRAAVTPHQTTRLFSFFNKRKWHTQKFTKDSTTFSSESFSAFCVTALTLLVNALCIS